MYWDAELMFYSFGSPAYIGVWWPQGYATKIKHTVQYFKKVNILWKCRFHIFTHCWKFFSSFNFKDLSFFLVSQYHCKFYGHILIYLGRKLSIRSDTKQDSTFNIKSSLSVESLERAPEAQLHGLQGSLKITCNWCNVTGI